MISQRSLLALLVALVALVSSTQAFCTPPTIPAKNKVALIRTCSSTQLAERRWNFNEGRSPWGLKTNAEIWNGRVAQMAFTVIFLQELITGKGVIEGIQNGDIVNLAFLGVAVVSTVGLTAFLASKGTEEYADYE